MEKTVVQPLEHCLSICGIHTASDSIVTLRSVRTTRWIIIYNDNENDSETSPSFSLCFCTHRDERLIASMSSSITTITNLTSLL